MTTPGVEKMPPPTMPPTAIDQVALKPIFCVDGFTAAGAFRQHAQSSLRTWAWLIRAKMTLPPTTLPASVGQAKSAT